MEKYQPFSSSYEYAIWDIKYQLSETLANQPKVTVPLKFANPTRIDMYDEKDKSMLDQNISENDCCVLDYIEKNYIEKYKYIPKV